MSLFFNYISVKVRLSVFFISAALLLAATASSSPADGPGVVGAPGATSRHSGNDRNQQRYSLYFSVSVTDPQGASDIASVVVTGPTSLTYTLTDPQTDGTWDLWTQSYDTPPSTGTYIFRVTDKAGNWTEATDNITAILDFPRNVIPSHYSIISTQSPVFSWNAVAGASGYNIVIADVNGNPIWSKNGFAATSVTFNDDATATSSFTNGGTYYWEVNCYDADGNIGEQDYWIAFVYSTNTSAPFLTDPYVRSAHYGDDYGNQDYRLQLNIRVLDPQGLSDIASVKVTGTGGAIYTLTDDNADGYYDCWFYNLSTAPQAGTYIYRATDKSGNWTEKTTTLSGTLDFPSNVSPINNAVLNNAAPVFSWNTVSGAVRNEIWINDINGKLIWGRWDMAASTSSVTFNYDGLATEALKEGMLYTWVIKAIDDNNNSGEHYGRQFVFSSDVAKPLIGNHNVVTYHGGDDLGHEEWGYDLWVDIADPQGSTDIASVIATGPDGTTYTLSDPENDGRFSGWPRSSSQLQLGQCQFRVTDKSGNTATVSDTLYAWIDYPRNLLPATNHVSVSATPVFSWDNVPGVTHYQLYVTPNGQPPSWGGSNIYSTNTVTYNFDGTGQNLKTGTVYYWDLRSFDSKGNYGYHYGNSLIYSTSGNSPVLINTSAYSGHYGIDNGGQSYYLHFATSSFDPQGSADIASVIVTGPDQKTYTLTSNNEKSYYDNWFGGTTAIPVLGPYKFRITDKSGNWTETTKNVMAVLDYPKNITPLQSEVVNTPEPKFSWKKVEGATKYTIRVTDLNGKAVWGKDNFTDTTIVYNSDGTASESLKNGYMYSFTVNAYDADNNFGEQNNRVFYYSTSTVNPVMICSFFRSRHWTDGSLIEWWGLDGQINVSDPQGADNIDSVWIEGPGQYHQRLFDNGINGDGTANDSRYTLSTGTTVPVLKGVYTINSCDRDGNKVILKDTINNVLDYPKGLNVKHNSIISVNDFPVFWNTISGATRCEVAVYTPDWSRTMWSSGKIPGLLSTEYNKDNTGTALVDGDAYVIVVRADDGDSGNESEIGNIKFVYRSDGRHTVFVDTSNTSGTEYGTKLKPYNTLKEAIERTIDTDTVLVAPGIYQGGIDNIGAITLKGSGPLKSIIRGGHLNLVSSNTTLSGFSITESDQSAVLVNGDSNIVIVNNIIADNAGHGIVSGWGGLPSKKLVIRNNTIVNNLWNGISIERDQSEATILNNIISHCGSGISVSTNSIINNSFNIVYGNNNAYLNLTAGQGDIEKDPLYTDRQNKIYTLSAASPAVDSGDPDQDKDLKEWITDPDDRDPDTTRMDMGAVFLDQRLLVPDAPVNLTAISCNDLVTLKWNKNRGLYFNKYRIYSGPDADKMVRIDSTSGGISDTVKVIAGLTHLQTYFFRISAVNRGGMESSHGTAGSIKVQTGLVPRIKSKWSGDVLICYNPGDSVVKYQWYKNSLSVSGAVSQYYEAKKQSGVYTIQTTDKNGCVNTSRSLTLSGAKSIDVFPNPATGPFILKLSNMPEGNVNIFITDTYGRKIKEIRTVITDSEPIKEISISHLSTGIFYINVSDSNNEYSVTKVIVSK